MTELDSLYESIDRLKAKGVVADSYAGTGEMDESDNGVLSDFIEYIYTYHSRNRPEWLEALYQVLTWQFETFHEWAGAYYDNFYGESSHEMQEKTADFLRRHGYSDLEMQFRRGIVSCKSGEYPQTMVLVAQEIREWMWNNMECVWKFCLDILEQNRWNWPEAEERKADV